MGLLNLRLFDVLRSFRFARMSLVNLLLSGLVDLIDWSLFFLLINDFNNRGLVVGQEILILFMMGVGILMIIVELSELI